MKFSLLIITMSFCFSLHAFNGYRIEKRHYRKGYYIHICHAPKNRPIYAQSEYVATNVTAAKEIPQRTEEQSRTSTESPQEEINPSRNNPPVSQAPVPNN